MTTPLSTLLLDPHQLATSPVTMKYAACLGPSLARHIQQHPAIGFALSRDLHLAVGGEEASMTPGLLHARTAQLRDSLSHARTYWVDLAAVEALFATVDPTVLGGAPTPSGIIAFADSGGTERAVTWLTDPSGALVAHLWSVLDHHGGRTLASTHTAVSRKGVAPDAAARGIFGLIAALGATEHPVQALGANRELVELRRGTP